MKKIRILLFMTALAMLMLLGTVTVSAAGKEGWVKVGSEYKWRQADGTILRQAGWNVINGRKYYLKSNGTVQTGWLTLDTGKYFLNTSSEPGLRGRPKTGKQVINGKTYFFSSVFRTLGKMAYGLVKSGNYYNYYDKNAGGAMVTSKWVTVKGKKYYFNRYGSSLKGMHRLNRKLYYFYTDGHIVQDRYGVQLKGNYYRCDKNGVLTQVSELEGLAGLQVEKTGRTLRGAFDWSSNLQYYAILPGVGAGEKAEDVYAQFGFENGMGDCYVSAATFYWMAKVLGEKNLEFVMGHVAGTGGQKLDHAWVEQKEGDLYWFYDPYNANRGRVSWHFLYGTKNSSVYIDAHNHKVQAS
ncbi:MAG: hypothetical protein IIY55_08680, partial [Blautia sp.]|nr:hypothetical protein [Blautia sp.]